MRRSETWLVIGASGLLGHGLCQDLLAAGVSVSAIRHSHGLQLPGAVELEADLTAPGTPRRLLGSTRAETVVYAAGLTNVDACERDEALAQRLHADVPAALAEICGSEGRRFVAISTDHLWEGTQPLVSEDTPLAPVNAYARTKAAGEAAVREAMPEALILRTNFFGAGRPWRKSLSDWMLEELRAGRPMTGFVDAHFTPIAVPLLSRTIRNAVTADLGGLYHAAGGERVSKYDFAVRLADWAGLPRGLVRPGRLGEARLLARRPLDMSLSTAKLAAALGLAAPSLDQSLAAVLGQPVAVSVVNPGQD